MACTYTKTVEYTTLEFVDNGKGIPEKDIPFVKEKFYRVDTGRSRESNSMGI